MSPQKTAGILVSGLVLVVLGIFFLAVNLGWVRVDWLTAGRLLLPSLFLLFGLYRLVGHFGTRPDPSSPVAFRSQLLSGLFWTTLGTVLMLHVLDYLDAVQTIGTYWPALFILFGLGKIVDYYRLQGKVGLRATEIFGLIFVLFFGITCRAFAESHWPLVRDWLRDEMRVTLPKDRRSTGFSFREETELPRGSAREIAVENLYGDVRVGGERRPSIKVELEKKVELPEEASADALARRLRIVSELQGDRRLIGTNRSELGEEGKRIATHFTLLSPSDLAINVGNAFGRTICQGIEAPVSVRSSYGKVELERIGGPVEAVSTYESVVAKGLGGPSKLETERALLMAEDVTGNLAAATTYARLEAKRISGDLTARNHFGEVLVQQVEGDAHVEAPGSRVHLADVGGSVEINQSYRPVRLRRIEGSVKLASSYADVELEDIAGATEIQVKHGKVRLRHVEGGLKIQGAVSELILEGVTGPLEVVSSLRSVEVNGCHGPLQIENEYGSVTIDCPEIPQETIRVTNRNGSIHLRLPQSAGFTLAAQVEGGEIVSDFGPAPRLSPEGVAYLRADVGAVQGPLVELQTTHSRIRIEKR
jgi:DUF4097 and DUF4098 domain-containing protein YvlB